MVLRRLQQQQGHVALHLRHLNPHVASICQARTSSSHTCSGDDLENLCFMSSQEAKCHI